MLIDSVAKSHPFRPLAKIPRYGQEWHEREFERFFVLHFIEPVLLWVI